MTKAHALALLTLWANVPSLINAADRDTLQAFCSALDPNGDFDALTHAELCTVALEWSADEFHATNARSAT
jgi:hypothetical protein